MSIIHPLLLAGGLGTRLWPVSRKSYPKQFAELLGKNTLFQKSALRVNSNSDLKFGSPITLTTSDFRFIVEEQLEKAGIKSGHIIIEPESKNTGPAILAASLFAAKKNRDALILATPTDHMIANTKLFHMAINSGIKHAKKGKIITFASSPTRAETGYGYLQLNENFLDTKDCYTVEKFVEKPLKTVAEKMIKDGNYYWNTGIFLFKAVDMIKAFEILDPDTLQLVYQSLKTSKTDLNFLRLNPLIWQKLKAESIDYSIMEKSRNLVAVVYNSKWSDLGDWNALWNETKSGSSGISLSGSADAFDCSNTLLRSEADSQRIIGIGLNNIIAVAMPDAVLVAQKNRAQDVKTVVERLKSKNVTQAETFPKQHRPWGWFESLAFGDGFQVKRIMVKPGGKLSLQSHQNRSEHWVVVRGAAKITIETEIKNLSVGESVYVPLGAKHRMENNYDCPLILIEVQTGDYLGEDDIVRYHDIYARDKEI